MQTSLNLLLLLFHSFPYFSQHRCFPSIDMPINCELSNLVITLCLLNFIGGGSGIMKDGLKKKMNKEY